MRARRPRGLPRERILRRALERRPAHIFAGGGAKPSLAETAFARREVTDLEPGGSASDGTVVLSEPWRPEPWKGEPIRFFFVFVNGRDRPEPGRMPHLPLWARLSDGRTVEIQ
jgi:hypothetical protein